MFYSSSEYSYLILANQVLSIHPRVVFIEQFSAVFSLPQKDLPPSWMHFRILSHIIHSPIEYSPTVLISTVLSYFLRSVISFIWVGHHLPHLSMLLNEFLLIQVLTLISNLHFDSYRLSLAPSLSEQGP